MNIQDLEQYVRSNLNIPYVDFEGLEISTIKDILEALTIIINKYPSLKDSICSIGNNEYINNQYNLFENSNKRKNIKWNDFVVNEEETMSTIGIGSHIPIIKNGYLLELQSFIAIAYSDLLRNKDINELNNQAKSNAEFGFHPRHCTSFKCSIYHEIGHILDFILNLSKDKQLYELIKEKSNNFMSIHTQISEYALYGGLTDIIAEAFAEYIACPNANELIASIGTYIDKKYKLFEDSKVFKINQKFIAHLIKAEETMSNRRF